MVTVCEPPHNRHARRSRAFEVDCQGGGRCPRLCRGLQAMTEIYQAASAEDIEGTVYMELDLRDAAEEG